MTDHCRRLSITAVCRAASPGPAAGGQLDLFPEALGTVTLRVLLDLDARELACLGKQLVVRQLRGDEPLGAGEGVRVELEVAHVVRDRAQARLQVQGLERV